MLSAYMCPCHGILIREMVKSYQIFHAGTNRDGWWTGEDMVKQLDIVIPLFEYFHKGKKALFMYDNSSGHLAYPENAILITKFNKNDKVVKEDDTKQIKETTFINSNGEIVNQPMKYIPNGKSELHWIGLENLLKQRKKYRPGMMLKCNANKGCYKNSDCNGLYCCLTKQASEEVDFKNQKSLLEEKIVAAGHKCIFLPPYHCELNPIEMFWCWSKYQTRRECNYTFNGLQDKVPKIVESCSISIIRRHANHCIKYMKLYKEGLFGKELEYAMKLYKSHRKVKHILTGEEKLSITNNPSIIIETNVNANKNTIIDVDNIDNDNDDNNNNNNNNNDSDSDIDSDNVVEKKSISYYASTNILNDIQSVIYDANLSNSTSNQIPASIEKNNLKSYNNRISNLRNSSSLLSSILLKRKIEDHHWYTDKEICQLGRLLGNYSKCSYYMGAVTADIIPLFQMIAPYTPCYMCLNIKGISINNNNDHDSNYTSGIHWVACVIIKHLIDENNTINNNNNNNNENNTINNNVIDVYDEDTNNYNLYTHTILIKNSFGENNSKAELDKFELAFKAKFYNIETIHHPSTEQNDGSSCGPLTINNLCIIAEYINNHGYKELINNFTTIKFTNNNDVENIREDHQKCIKEINCTK